MSELYNLVLAILRKIYDAILSVFEVILELTLVEWVVMAALCFLFPSLIYLTYK